jgi:hypothetical protein
LDDNPFLLLQTRASEQITEALNAYRDARDPLEEKVFFAIYGSPLVQALLGVNEDSIARPILDASPEKLAARQARTKACESMLGTGGFDEALTRSVLYVVGADHVLDQRCAFALNVARQRLMHLSLAAFKVLVRDQFFVLQFEPQRAIEALADIVPKATARTGLLQQTRAIANAGGPLTKAEGDRLDRLSQALAAPIETPEAPPAIVGPTRGARPEAVSH